MKRLILSIISGVLSTIIGFSMGGVLNLLLRKHPLLVVGIICSITVSVIVYRNKEIWR